MQTMMLIAAPALAVEPLHINLHQAVKHALENNKLLQADHERLNEADASVQAASGRLMPSIKAASGVSRSNSPMSNFGGKLLQQRFTAADFAVSSLNNPAYLTNYRSSLTLQAPLYQGGRQWAAKEKAEQSQQAAEFEFKLSRQQLTFAVIQAYSNTFRLNTREQAARSALDAAEQHLQQTRSLLDRGLAIQSDVLDARAHVSDTRLALLQVRNARLRAMDELGRLLGHSASEQGLELTAEPVLGNKWMRESTQLEGNQEMLSGHSLDDIIEQHPQLAALKRQLKAEQAGIREASAGLLPQVGLVATQEWNNNTPIPSHPNSSIAAEVSMNLFAGGSDLAARRGAQARFTALQYRLQDQRQLLHNDLAQASRQLREAQTEVEARHDSLEQARESLRILNLRMQQGLEKSTDVLDAQTRADQAVARDIDARFKLIVSRAGLLLAAGRLTPEDSDESR